MRILRDRRSVTVLGAVCLLAFASVASADVDVVLLEKTYERPTGEPVTVTDPFPGVEGAATLTVTTDGTVTSAIISVNGTQVFGTNDFKRKVTELTAIVDLGRQNEISVELRGEPGATLVSRLSQMLEADGAAVVGAAGGTVAVEAGPFTGTVVRIPAGALETSVLITAQAVPDPVDPDFDGETLELRPHDLQFSVDASIVMAAEDPSAGSLQHTTVDEPYWVSLGQDECEAGHLCASISSFSWFRVFYARLCHLRLDAGWVCNPVAWPWKRPWGEGPDSDWWPVIMVHGINISGVHLDLLPIVQAKACGQAGRRYWTEYPELLTREGLDIWRFDYDHEIGIDGSAQWLGSALGEVRDATSRERVTVVAHSMGGLVARRQIADETGTQQTARLITVGTPHLGSAWALGALPLPGCTEAAWQMLPGSSFLSDLNDLGPVSLNSQVPEYVFIAGLDRRPEPSGPCLLRADDGVVRAASAHAKDDDWEPPIDVYGAKAKLIAEDGYPHHPAWTFAQDCGELPQTHVELKTAPQHAVYQDVLKWAKIGPAPTGSFEILLVGGPSNGRILTSDGVDTGDRLNIPQINGIWPASLSDDGSKLAYVTGTSGGAGWLRVYDFETGTTNEGVLYRYWLQTLKWLPGSNSEVIFYDDVTKKMQVINVETGAQRLWQATLVDGFRHYRGGIDWDDGHNVAFFRAGCPGAGGDGVYTADICNGSGSNPADHLCLPAGVVELPGGGSCSWADIAADPFLSSDGETAFYITRRSWNNYEIVRRDLAPGGQRTVLRSLTSSAGQNVQELYGDSHLFVSAPSKASPGLRGLYDCSTEAVDDCTEIYSGASGDWNAVIASKRFVRP